ncbi:hypothetical protein DFH09DRAFT_1287885 [Mycena vulgaris]|nr:hypothetical protein DFH09DRAFT_1287885 [Mycena vulgaris]
MSATIGRPKGTKNKPDPKAGGARENSGPKPRDNHGASGSRNSANNREPPAPAAPPRERREVRGNGIAQLYDIFNSRHRYIWQYLIYSQQLLKYSSSRQTTAAATNPDVNTSNSEAMGTSPAVPFPFLQADPPDFDSDENSEPDSDFEDLLDDTVPLKNLADEATVDTKGVISLYFTDLKRRLVAEMDGGTWPKCYDQGSFWIHPPAPIFALMSAAKSTKLAEKSKAGDKTGQNPLKPTGLYYPSGCAEYGNTHRALEIKGWNDKPLARRVVGLDRTYYVVTMQIQCKKKDSRGCGRSWNLYDPLILDQLDHGLADCFSASLTARSGIDKTLMTLIRAGIAHRLSASTWSKILCELHVREHDLRELQYLYAIHRRKKNCQDLDIEEESYEPFSSFEDKSKYAGFYPSRWYINNVYMDYMQHIRPILDQCMALLTALIIKWDHSFKMPKYLMKLNGVMTFVALFTIVNEFEQIRSQAFVPTKSLSHIRAALEGIVKSLDAYGLPQPILGFTDNVASDAAITFMQYIPSLAEGVSPVEINEFPDIACSGVLGLLREEDEDDTLVDIGFDMEWEFTTRIGASGPQKTALIQIAVDKVVYLFYVYALKKLPGTLVTLLSSKQYVKVGRHIAADFQKLSRDFPEFKLPLKRKKQFIRTLDIGDLAAKKKVVPTSSASLVSIVAATLGVSLSKDLRISSWSTPNYSLAQTNYAVLDAYVLLMLLQKLRTLHPDGQSLSPLTPLGQHVSLYVRSHEVARGMIIEQPPYFEIAGGSKLGVSTTKTRALIRVDEVLAPDCVIPHHRTTLSALQNGRDTFNPVVSISSLKTRNVETSVLPQTTEPDRIPGLSSVILPPVETVPSAPVQALPDQSEMPAPPSTTQSALPKTNPQPDNLSESDSEESEAEADDIYCQDFVDRADPADREFFQQLVGVVPSRILADIFHEIDKVCRTISRKHTLRRHFARAFSDTMLIPDVGDKAAVEAVLSAKGLTWDQARSKSPGWVWRRVRCYVPQKDVLHHILSEFFDSWADVKCSVTKLPLFSDETRQKAQGVLNDVLKGWVSDPVGIPLYVVEGMDRNNLTLYHSNRGTNSVEGDCEEILQL